MATKKKGDRLVQGAYVKKDTKDFLKGEFEKKEYHSPTEYAGDILDKHVEEEKRKQEKVETETV